MMENRGQNRNTESSKDVSVDQSLGDMEQLNCLEGRNPIIYLL